MEDPISALRVFLVTSSNSNYLSRVLDGFPYASLYNMQKAECLRYDDRITHDAPSEHCHCGYYGIKPDMFWEALEASNRLLDLNIMLVVAGVFLSGKVIETSWGYRSEYEEVVCLANNVGITKDPVKAQCFSSRYNIPLSEVHIPQQSLYVRSIIERFRNG